MGVEKDTTHTYYVEYVTQGLFRIDSVAMLAGKKCGDEDKA